MGVTKEFIVLDVRRSCILWIVICACISCGVYHLRVYPPYLEYWQLPSGYVSVLMLKTTAAFWISTIKSLKKSARDLNKYFKVSECCIQRSASCHVFKCFKMAETSLTFAGSGVCLSHVRTAIPRVPVTNSKFT